jgi:hypothetical protein
MKRKFVELSFFRKCWASLRLDDEELRNLQYFLGANPDAGDIMPNCGGARKFRISLPGKGKSGGARIIYVDFGSQQTIYLMMAYPKSVQDNLTEEQKKNVQKWVKELKDLNENTRRGQ